MGSTVQETCSDGNGSLGTARVPSTTEMLNLKFVFNLNFNSYMWVVAVVLGSTGLDSRTLFFHFVEV